MTPSTIDQTDPATLAASEGQAALGRGDTALARTKFVEAGDTLLREVAGAYKHADKTLLWFLAATQFYKGGEYHRALELTKKIEARLLPEKTRDLLPQFVRDVNFRTSPDYVARMRQTCTRLWHSGEYRQILDLLQDHPYVYDSGPLAFLRAVLCAKLGQWRAAALFYAMAIPGVPDGSDFMLMAISRALYLPAEGRVEEAWEYISRLRELLPNSVTNIVASLVTFFRASQQAGAERLSLHQEQLRYFEEGWRVFKALPLSKQQHPEMRSIMSICIDAAMMAYMRLGRDTQARAVVEEVIALEPNAPGPLTARGMLTYPSDKAVNDFRIAACLPSPGYVPFLFLAHHAFDSDRFAECERLCREALARKPGRIVQAQLHGWIAVCRGCMGASREEVEELFNQAFEIDPDNEQVAANYQVFKESREAASPTPTNRWNTRVNSDSVEPDFVTWESEHSGVSGRDATVQELLLAGSI